VFLTAVMERRVNIKFCVKLGKTPTETYEMLQTVYGDEALNRSSVFERFKPAFPKLVGREPICGGSRKVFEI
jgi:hypothetical protein